VATNRGSSVFGGFWLRAIWNTDESKRKVKTKTAPLTPNSPSG